MKDLTKQAGMLAETEIDQLYIKLDQNRFAFKSVSKAKIPAKSGKAFRVNKGQVFRIIQEEGPQIGDVWLFNAHDTKERFMAHTTFLHEGAYPKKYSQFWSCMPEVRPMATMLVEHSGNPKLPINFNNHVVLGAHCTTKQWEMLTGIPDHNSCHQNGIDAVKEFGLTEQDILNDNFMVFQPSFIQADGRGDSVASQSKPGDYAEFYAEMDLIVAVSACPVGDYAVPMTEPDKITTRALGFEILDTTD